MKQVPLIVATLAVSATLFGQDKPAAPVLTDAEKVAILSAQSAEKDAEISEAKIQNQAQQLLAGLETQRKAAAADEDKAVAAAQARIGDKYTIDRATLTVKDIPPPPPPPAK